MTIVTEKRYFRQIYAVVNGLNANTLETITSLSGSTAEIGRSGNYLTQGATIAIDVFIRHNDESETQIMTKKATATITGSHLSPIDIFGYHDIEEWEIATTDSIRIRVYGKIGTSGSWQEFIPESLHGWQTEQLGANLLNSGRWTVTYTVHFYCWEGDTYFGFNYDTIYTTPPKNSNVDNFSYTIPSVSLKTVTDSFMFSDAIFRNKKVEISDSLVFTDSLKTNKTIQISESLSLISTIFVNKSIKVSDSLALNDSAFVNKLILVSDTIEFIDAITITALEISLKYGEKLDPMAIQQILTKIRPQATKRYAIVAQKQANYQAATKSILNTTNISIMSHGHYYAFNDMIFGLTYRLGNSTAKQETIVKTSHLFCEYFRKMLGSNFDFVIANKILSLYMIPSYIP